MLRTSVRRLLSRSSRNASTLVLVEHDSANVNAATLNTVTAAAKLGGPVHAVVAGDSCSEVGFLVCVWR